jgi:PPK2 family polyphosphate:nucleotide phosphotransferase
MFKAVDSPYLVPFHDQKATFKLARATTKPPEDAPGKKKCKKLLKEKIQELKPLQDVLYAHSKHSVLLVFQAMDAAGKDGTIRAVMSGINPAGCQVYSFKQPSNEELQHDFLWRTTKCLPEQGRIGIFNRSYYEEVLVVRVHPEYLAGQSLDVPESDAQLEKLFDGRYQSIRDHELHLARHNTTILKFWLNVSKEEQKQRFLSRIEDPAKNWKFSMGDIKERGYWDNYMGAYEKALGETSQPWAPWYAIPADDKPFMRLKVAEIIVDALKSLPLQYPELHETEMTRLLDARKMLENEK